MKLLLKVVGCGVFGMAVLVGNVRGQAAALDQPAKMDGEWRLWLDDKASWQNDAIYLPDEVDLAKLPVNPPTGGWAVLTDTAGIPVTLPSTVEEHYWNRPPSRTSGKSPDDIVTAAGNYLGVSWWYRSFTAPALAPGERLVFAFPAARLRSEVYVNGRLVSYNIISEVPFTADATDAFKSDGNNVIAVRITNPGGELAWPDFNTLDWGKAKLPSTHAFGGIAGGVTMEVRGAVSVGDLAVFNKPETTGVKLQAEIDSTGPAYNGPVALSITRKGVQVWSGTATVQVPAKGTATVSVDATVPNAELWDVDRPNLYQAVATLPRVAHSSRATTFGFRWFTAKGVGTDAKLYLNGRRIVPRSAISWGFWSLNGIFPDQAAADREVAAMRALGLDSLQTHRHMPKAIVLDTFDREGLLHYCEPGGGVFSFLDSFNGADTGSTKGPIDTSGNGAQLDFINRYELAKILAMIKAGRSHPSVTIWTVQNEVQPDLHNPRIFYVLNKMREADPSRIIILHSGDSTENEVWTLPYSTEWMHDDGHDYSGWRDQHTALASSGVYQDSVYKSPTDYLYRSDDLKEILVWGEMATAASPDDHTKMVDWYKRNNRTGYDLAAHEVLVSAYEKFLDDFKFRAAFPTAKALFVAAGNKHYFYAQHVLENARMCNVNDYIVLSGWESTTIDNHSGLVDSLRLTKGDPSILKQASVPELLVIRPRHYVVAKGDTATVDVFQVNESNLAGPHRLTVTASVSGAAPFFRQTFPVTVIGGETYGQLLQANIQFPINRTGVVTIHAELASADNPKVILRRDERILVIDPQPAPIVGNIAWAGTSNEIVGALKKQFDVTPVPLESATGKLKDIIVVPEIVKEKWQHSASSSNIENTPDPELYKQQMYGPPGTLRTFRHLAPGKVTVDLYMAETSFSQAGARLFDLALNGQTVLKDFDIFKESGGKNRALIKSFTVDAPKGEVAVSIASEAKDSATLAAIRVTDSAGTVVREAFRDSPYKDSAGNPWKPITFDEFDWSSVLPAALDRVKNDGTRLVLLTMGHDDAEAAATALAANKVLTYSGCVGVSGPSWMGFWYFGRKHWLLDGLPSDCVLDWPYQIAQGNGFQVSGAGLEGVIGYGKDHAAKIGLGAFVVPFGKGQVVFFGLPGLQKAFTENNADGFQPVTAKRLIYNALQY